MAYGGGGSGWGKGGGGSGWGQGGGGSGWGQGGGGSGWGQGGGGSGRGQDGYGSDDGSQGYGSGGEWDPAGGGEMSDPEDDYRPQQGAEDNWQGAPTAMTYELMEGEIRKKKFGSGWQYGRIFKQWIPAPKVNGFKCSGTTINIWVPDTQE